MVRAEGLGVDSGDPGGPGGPGGPDYDLHIPWIRQSLLARTRRGVGRSLERQQPKWGKIGEREVSER